VRYRLGNAQVAVSQEHLNPARSHVRRGIGQAGQESDVVLDSDADDGLLCADLISGIGQRGVQRQQLLSVARL
jgi:hypothetical protein